MIQVTADSIPPALGLGKQPAVDTRLTAVMVGLIVFLSACGAHLAAGVFERPPMLWPTNAVVLAFLIRSRPADWPLLALSGFIANMAACIFFERELALSLGIQLCNAAEALICAAGLRSLFGPRLDFNRLPHVIGFGLLALGASAAACVAAGGFVALAGGDASWRMGVVWTLSDALGLMIVTPALLALDGKALSRVFGEGRPIRTFGLILSLCPVTAAVFMMPALQQRALVLAALVLVAFQTEVAGVAFGLLVIGLTATLVSALGWAAPTAGVAGGDMLLTQSLLLVGALTAFPVAAAVGRRRKLEAALAAQAHDFQVLVDNTSDVIVRFDQSETIVYVSAACSRFGYRQDQMVGRSCSEFIHPEDLPMARLRIARALEGHPLSPEDHFEHRIRSASGEWIWMEGRPQRVTEHGRPVYEIVTLLTDVTARRTAEEALATSEARYRLLAEMSRDIILHTDAEGTILYASPSLRRLGYEPEQVIGSKVWDAVHPEDFEAHVERTRDLWAGKQPHKSDLRQQRVRCADGNWVWLEGNPTVVRDDTGAITGIVNAFRDITSRKALETELERKRDEAEAATVAKTEFLTNMSHEIRTPLTAIIGFGGVLESTADLPDLARQYAQRISIAGQALLSVVNDILDFSKIEAGQVELEPRPFDPAQFLAETVQLVEAQGVAKGLVVCARLAGDLPPAVNADSVRLRQVLLNLLSNAIKFTAEGEVSVEAAFDARDGGVLRFAVSDTGVGIPQSHQARLFERFSQADASINRRYGGTGLGLAICKNLAELMGGSIEVESAEGRGATFRFSIAAPAAEALAPAGVSGELEPDDAPPARILVVDDSVANLEVVRALLGVFGHELVEASSGAEAVEKAMEKPFDLILMDIQMPGMDGLAATRAIRGNFGPNRLTPILALSADVLDLHQRACRDAGMDDHIAKPINTAELFTKVAHWSTGRTLEAVRA